MPPPPTYAGFRPLPLCHAMTFPPGSGGEFFFGPFRPIVWLESCTTILDPYATQQMTMYLFWSIRIPPPPITNADLQFIDRPFINLVNPDLPAGLKLRSIRQWAPWRNSYVRLGIYNYSWPQKTVSATLLFYTPDRHNRDE